MASNRELFCHFPRLKEQLSAFHLAHLPTPVEPFMLSEVDARAPRSGVFIKRDDLTSDIYGGNKVRTLEFIFGGALSRGVQRVVATGAYGSNHAVATILHARRAGLSPGTILFPQPGSVCALENLEVLLAQQCAVHWIPHWVFLPWSMWRLHRQYRQAGEEAEVMVPGGATPEGALGYVSAALELAGQVHEGRLPCPRSIVLPIGSTCTTAGLAVGIHLASRMGFGFVNRAGRACPPRILAVSVTPWPVASYHRIQSLARRTAHHISALTGDSSCLMTAGDCRRIITVDRKFIGRGYGHVSLEAAEAVKQSNHLPFRLDTIYSGKAFAGLVDNLVKERSLLPTVFWSTKSSVPLPSGDPCLPDGLPRRVVRWIEKVNEADLI